MKFYNLKDEDELTFTGKQLREWKEIIIRETLSNLSPSVRTSPNGDFSNEKEHNISLNINSELNKKEDLEKKEK